MEIRALHNFLSEEVIDHIPDPPGTERIADRQFEY